MMRIKIAVLAALMGASTASFALTAMERKQYATWTKYMMDPMQGHVDDVKKYCGYDVSVKLDEKLVTPFMKANTSAAAYCDGALEALYLLCQDEAYKPAIAKQVKSVNCTLGQEGKADFKLTGTQFEMSFGVGATNLRERAKTYLTEHLK